MQNRMTIINGRDERRGSSKSNKSRCPIDGKVIYTEEEAIAKLESFVKRGRSDEIETMNVYMCVPTGSYHIGHKTRGCS